MDVNKLILGDNLEKLKEIPTESIDLIYLDPPFFSNRNYENIWGDKAEKASFQDRWAGGIEHYIGWLYERVEEMHRVLKNTGSIFLHCDWHASHYIKIDILDKLFSRSNFINEIVWCYTSASTSKACLPNKHDIIFWYSKSPTFTINLDNIRVPYNSKTQANYKKGLKGSGTFYDGEIKTDEGILNENGKIPEDWWTDIAISARFPKNSDNNIGYPTQKPMALLERIIKLASNEGDTILDPFVGGGTTVAVADKLKRKWIGIDISAMAIKVTDYRLKKQKDVFSQPYDLILRIHNYEQIRNMDAFVFEKWIIEQFGGAPNNKKGGDSGIDGKKNGIPIQVKRSTNISVNVIKNFRASLSQFNRKLFEKNIKEKKTAGYIIAFSFGKGAIEEAARLKSKENIIIELIKVSEIIPYGDPPKVKLTAQEIEPAKYMFKVTADKELEFTSWDFDYNPKEGFKPAIILDKSKTQIQTFEPGKPVIASVGTDKEGLDGMDTVKITINEQ